MSSNSQTALSEEFAGPWEAHLPYFRVQALALVASHGDAEDILQEAATTAWEKYSHFHRGTSFRAWVSQIVRNKVMNHGSRQKRNRCIFDSPLVDLLASDISAGANELDRQAEWLQECLAELPSRSRAIVLSRYQADTSVQDLADKLGRSPAAVYKALQNIRRVLLKCVTRKRE